MIPSLLAFAKVQGAHFSPAPPCTLGGHFQNGKAILKCYQLRMAVLCTLHSLYAWINDHTRGREMENQTHKLPIPNKQGQSGLGRGQEEARLGY